MKRHGASRHDMTLTLGAELCVALDAYAQRMAEREPGFRPSRSAAARQLLAHALRSDAKVAG